MQSEDADKTNIEEDPEPKVDEATEPEAKPADNEDDAAAGKAAAGEAAAGEVAAAAKDSAADASASKHSHEHAHATPLKSAIVRKTPPALDNGTPPPPPAEVVTDAPLPSAKSSAQLPAVVNSAPKDDSAQSMQRVVRILTSKDKDIESDSSDSDDDSAFTDVSVTDEAYFGEESSASDDESYDEYGIKKTAVRGLGAEEQSTMPGLHGHQDAVQSIKTKANHGAPSDFFKGNVDNGIGDSEHAAGVAGMFAGSPKARGIPGKKAPPQIARGFKGKSAAKKTPPVPLQGEAEKRAAEQLARAQQELNAQQLAQQPQFLGKNALPDPAAIARAQRIEYEPRAPYEARAPHAPSQSPTGFTPVHADGARNLRNTYESALPNIEQPTATSDAANSSLYTKLDTLISLMQQHIQPPQIQPQQLQPPQIRPQQLQPQLVLPHDSSGARVLAAQVASVEQQLALIRVGLGAL